MSKRMNFKMGKLPTPIKTNSLIRVQYWTNCPEHRNGHATKKGIHYITCFQTNTSLDRPNGSNKPLKMWNVLDDQKEESTKGGSGERKPVV